jgi:hypothetical protein
VRDNGSSLWDGRFKHNVVRVEREEFFPSTFVKTMRVCRDCVDDGLTVGDVLYVRIYLAGDVGHLRVQAARTGRFFMGYEVRFTLIPVYERAVAAGNRSTLRVDRSRLDAIDYFCCTAASALALASARAAL